MKKLLSIVLVISTLLSTCFLFTSCSKEPTKEPTFEENIVGTWESKKDGSKNKVTLVFEYTDETLRGTQSYYDYDNSEWGEITFKVEDRTDYTMTLIYDVGKLDVVSYSLAKDTLVFDNAVYKNESKNIEIDPEQKTYILDGVPMPVRAGMYFGMTKSEIESMADSKYIKSDTDYYSGNDVYHYEAPVLFNLQVDHNMSYATYYFDENGRFYEHILSFGDYDTEKLIELKIKLMDAFSSQYGKYRIEDHHAGDKYVWQSGNMIVEMLV
jgi:major membrane immunogen (membrane-anchored lipoprotein)